MYDDKTSEVLYLIMRELLEQTKKRVMYRMA